MVDLSERYLISFVFRFLSNLNELASNVEQKKNGTISVPLIQSFRSTFKEFPKNFNLNKIFF